MTAGGGDYAFDAERLLTGDHRREAPPHEGGRWGLSIRATLPEAVAGQVDRLTRALLPLVGPGHWPTGLRGSGHVTLKMLAPWSVRTDTEAARTGRSMLARLPAQLPHLGFVRAAITEGGVVALLEPVGTAWAEVRAALDLEVRPLVHATAVHFAAPIAHPAEVIAMVAGPFVAPASGQVPEIQLVRYDFDHGVPGMSALSLA